MSDDNGITIPGRLVERILLVVLLVFTGGGTVASVTDRNNLHSNDQQICAQTQRLRTELATLFEPFLDVPSQDPKNPSSIAGRAALKRVIEHLRERQDCP